MRLFFTCPEVMKTFASDDYSLHQGHRIIINSEGGKELQGNVSLNAGCPFCGKKHQYDVKDLSCPLSGGNNEE